MEDKKAGENSTIRTCSLLSIGDHIKEQEMGRTLGMHGIREKCIQGSDGET
jgi:hypothetical protein